MAEAREKKLLTYPSNHILLFVIVFALFFVLEARMA